MPPTILVPLDGSALAERALPVADGLAGASRSQLLLVRVIPGEADQEDTSAEVREDAYLAEDYLRSVANMTGRHTDVDVQSLVVHDRVRAGILKASHEHRADLIVMSTHGRSGLGRWIYGSTVDDVLRHADLPVVVVPAGLRASRLASAERSPRILLALDGSDRAAGLVEPMRRLALELHAQIVLTRLVPEPPTIRMVAGSPVVGYATDQQLDDAREYLEGMARQLRTSVAEVTVRCEPGDASNRIARIADEEGADLIGLVTRGRTGVARFFQGSVTTATLRRAHVPVLILHSGRTDTVVVDGPSTDDQPASPQQLVDPTARALDFTTSELGLILEGLEKLQWSDQSTPADARAIDQLRRRLASDLAASVGSPAPVQQRPERCP
jgi:nucleotide-binding universal stress UspA family protein